VNGGNSLGEQHLMNCDEGEINLTPFDFNLQTCIYIIKLIFPVSIGQTFNFFGSVWWWLFWV